MFALLVLSEICMIADGYELSQEMQVLMTLGETWKGPRNLDPVAVDDADDFKLEISRQTNLPDGSTLRSTK